MIRIVATILLSLATPALAQSVQYPKGATPAQIAQHEAIRSSSAAFQQSLLYNPRCVRSGDGFVTCDPDPQVRLNYRKGTQTQGGGGSSGGSD